MAKRLVKGNAKSKISGKRKVRTTVGDLLSAAYEAAGCRADRAADLIQRGAMGQLLGRRLKFV